MFLTGTLSVRINNLLCYSFNFHFAYCNYLSCNYLPINLALYHVVNCTWRVLISALLLRNSPSLMFCKCVQRHSLSSEKTNRLTVPNYSGTSQGKRKDMYSQTNVGSTDKISPSVEQINCRLSNVIYEATLVNVHGYLPL